MRSGAIAALVVLALAWAQPSPAAGAAPLWVRLDVLENTVEGPATARCEIDGTLDGGGTLHWRVFFGEVRQDAGAAWAPIRARSGCAPVASEADPGPWALRGSPYLLVDVDLTSSGSTDGETGLTAALTIRTLTGFGSGGRPTYARRTERRALRLAQDGSAVIPVLVADTRAQEELRVRELLLRLRAVDLGSRRQVQYGEVAVVSDMPRASLLLDGSVVGHTAEEGPLVLPNVRTGERLVAIRDASGREAQQVVQIEPGQRREVSLALLPAATPSTPPGLRPLGRNPQGSQEFWRERDGAIVVRIPAGELRMGSPATEGEPAERPQHLVRLDGFLMDKAEVTWGQYRRFVAQTSRPPAKAPAWGMPETFPASNVTWEDARAFCTWVGGRLPSEAEWERAARADGARRYPWGDEWDPSRCNTRDGGRHAMTAAATHPECVGPYGVLDQAGSVWEWCADWFDDAYYAKSPEENPTGPATGDRRASRGGSWINPADWARSAFRQGTDPTWPDTLRGFRCIQDDPGVALVPTPSAAAPFAAPAPVEIQVVTTASPESAAVQQCTVLQAAGIMSPVSSWSAFGAARPRSGGGFDLADAPPRCGSGTLPDTAQLAAAGGVPFLLLEVSATPMTDQGAMDPGPVRVFQIVLTLTSRQLASVSPEGVPLYGDPTTDQRAVRLSHADELVVPVALGDDGARKILGPEVLIRVRRGHTAMAYGAIMVMAAAPDSEIRIDGGTVGRASSDGTALLTSIPVGARDVRLRDAEGRSVARIVTVVPQRTVVASATQSAAIGMTPSGKNGQGAAEFQRRRDGAPMVQIPAGEFVMGNLATEGAPLPHTVNVSRFLIDKLPVTRGRFTQFAAATGRPLPPQPYWVVDDTHPVVFVTWDEARAYCEWAGARLPTEAEREKAARGTDGRLFPWGNEAPSPERGVFRRNWGYEGTAAVGMRPAGASPYGVLDAGGNVWEWCADWYDPDYYKSSPTQDPLGPNTGRAHIVRGGSWDSRPTVLSSSARNWGYVGYREGDFGFRCAADPPG